jgi:hypothetical protein
MGCVHFSVCQSVLDLSNRYFRGCLHGLASKLGGGILWGHRATDTDQPLSSLWKRIEVNRPWVKRHEV